MAGNCQVARFLWRSCDSQFRPGYQRMVRFQQPAECGDESQIAPNTPHNSF